MNKLPRHILLKIEEYLDPREQYPQTNNKKRHLLVDFFLNYVNPAYKCALCIEPLFTRKKHYINFVYNDIVKFNGRELLCGNCAKKELTYCWSCNSIFDMNWSGEDELYVCFNCNQIWEINSYNNSYE